MISLYDFYLLYIYPILFKFYNIKVVDNYNITKLDNSVIFISKHTSHNYDLLIGLITISLYIGRTIKGLGHYFIHYACPHYKYFGILTGNKNNADTLIANNQPIWVIPGGAEEMLIAYNNPSQINWISKSGNYRTGFAKLSKEYNIPIIPVSCPETEYMVFQPILFMFTYLRFIRLIDYFITFNKSPKLLYFKMVAVCLSHFVVIPIPIKLTFTIGKPLLIKEEETIIDFTKRCENELSTLIKKNL